MGGRRSALSRDLAVPAEPRPYGCTNLRRGRTRQEAALIEGTEAASSCRCLGERLTARHIRNVERDDGGRGARRLSPPLLDICMVILKRHRHLVCLLGCGRAVGASRVSRVTGQRGSSRAFGDGTRGSRTTRDAILRTNGAPPDGEGQ